MRDNLKIDLSPPKVDFKDLDDGQLFIWNGGLWMVYPHLAQFNKNEPPALFQAVLISNQDGGGFRCQRFELEDQVTPCVVEMNVKRIGK